MLNMNPRQSRRSARRRARPGFTLVEILIVVSIAAVILTVIVGGGYAAIRNAKIQKTQATLKVLDSVSNNYKEATELFPVFPATVLGTAPNYWPPTTDGMRDFLTAVYYVPSGALVLTDAPTVNGDRAIGDARGMLVALNAGGAYFDAANGVVLDAWFHPIFVKTAGTTTTHGVFQSAGPDGIPNNADDITSSGGAQ